MGIQSATVTATAGSLSAGAALTGTAVAANLALNVMPSTGDFGIVVFGTSSTQKTFTLTNTGNVATGVPVATFTGPGAVDFAVAAGGNTCTTSLAPTFSCTLSVVFTPHAMTSEVATLALTAPAGGQAMVPLSGRGSACAACPIDAGSVTPYVCERASAPMCVDSNWAEWPMPNGAVDSPPAPNLESYTANGDGTVTDGVTGLMWQQVPGGARFGWGSAATTGTAQNYCATLALAGHDDWRLPSGIELVSITDLSSSNPAINVPYFPNTPSGDFWSATPIGQSAQYVEFAMGALVVGPPSRQAYVRCVR
jgi:hypothetical protein